LEPRTLLSNYHWALDQSGAWDDPLNWTNGGGYPGVPGPNDYATISQPGVTVTVSTPVTVGAIRSVGTLNVSAGSFTVLNNQIYRSDVGSLHVSSGATFRAASSTSTDIENATVAGTLVSGGVGVIEFLAGGQITLEAGAVLTGSGFYANFGANVAVQGDSHVDSGLVMLSGMLDGPGVLTISGALTWDSGTITGTGTTIIAPTGSLALKYPDSKALTDGHVLRNFGTINWTDGGTWTVDQGAVVENLGTLTEEGSAVLRGATGALNNLGTINVDVGAAGVLAVAGGDVLNNTGALRLESGTLKLAAGGLLAGQVALAHDARLDVAGGTSELRGTVAVSGLGTVLLSGGRLAASPAGARWVFSPGATLDWQSGAIAIPTAATLAIDGALALRGPHDKQLEGGGTLSLAGQADDSGRGVLRVDGAMSGRMPTTLTILKQSTFELTVPTKIVNGAGAGGTIDNGGLFVMAGHGSMSTLGVPLNNTGTVRASSGELDLAGAVDQLSGSVLTGGTWQVGAQATLKIQSAQEIDTLGPSSRVRLDGPHASFTNLAGLAMVEGELSLLFGATFVTASDMVNVGMISLGPESMLDVRGNYTQGAQGALAVQLGGVASRPTLGTVRTSGQVTLGGGLMLSDPDRVLVPIGHTLIVIDNQGESPVRGTFTGLPPGGYLPPVNGMMFAVRYTKGTGNRSVAVTRLP
jgi:hypothetical protein